MGRKKKKKTPQKAVHGNKSEEAEEEEEALQAIFGELFRREEADDEIVLRVVPHPGDADANFVSVELCVRYPPAYPRHAAELRLQRAQGLDPQAVKSLAAQLQASAAEHAAAQEVAVFNLAASAQEFLRERNAAPVKEPSPRGPGGEAGASGWEALSPEASFSNQLARQLLQQPAAGSSAAGGAGAAAADAGAPGGAARVVGTGWVGVPAASLFGEEGEVAGGGAWQRLSTSPLHHGKRHMAASPPRPWQAASQMTAGRAVGAPGVVQKSPGTRGAQAPVPKPPQAPVAPSPAAAPPPPRPTAAAAAAGPATTAAAADGRGEWRRGVSLERREASTSGIGNVFSAVAHGISAVGRAVGSVAHIPRPLRRLLAGSGSADLSSQTARDGDDEASSSMGPGHEADDLSSASGAMEGGGGGAALRERQQLKRDLLLAHLLQSCASSRGGRVPDDCLPDVAEQLQSASLLPKWVGALMSQDPAMLDRAFERVFARELESSSAAADPRISQALETFWHPSTHSHQQRQQKQQGMQGMQRQESLDGSLSGGGGGGGGRPLARPSRTSSRLGAAPEWSRYEQDFEELHQIGRGGFGVVVLAVNRLDGRRYAIKKIPVDRRNPAAYGRILREVSTLSRLQHPHVVRYFQAWVEPVADATGLGLVDSESEAGAWGDTAGEDTDTATTTSAAFNSGRRAAARSDRLLLPPPTPRGLSDLAAGPFAAAGQEDAIGPGLVLGPPRLSGMSLGLQPVEEASAESGQARASSASSGRGGGFWQTASDATSSSPSSSTATDDDDDDDDSSADLAGAARGGMPVLAGAAIDLFSAPSEGSLATPFSTDETTSEMLVAGSTGREKASAKRAGSWGVETSSGMQRIGSNSGGMVHVLFIQMEFCPRTLCDALDSGLLQEEECWKVVRQILAGLAHIHAQGVIHRDLKPANVFYDAKGDIKLGDFGLAKFTATSGAGASTPVPGEASGDALPSSSSAFVAATPASAAAAARQQGGHGAGGRDGAGVVVTGTGTQPLGVVLGSGGVGMFSEQSGVCGTSFYISPEIKNGWASYDAKVDLYSLGVLAFELWHPFSTAMERYTVLDDLCSRGKVPVRWERKHPQVAQLVRWLLSPNPADRPSAREALRSHLLPPTVGDEQLQDLLRGMGDSPEVMDRVLDQLFSPISSSGNAAGGSMSEVEEMAGAPDDAFHVAAMAAAREAVQEAWERHGAVPMASHRVGHLPPGESPGAVRVLLQSGQQAALAYELRLPLALWLARRAAEPRTSSEMERGLRRYEVARVMRQPMGRGLPRGYMQADLDLVAGQAAGKGSGGSGGGSGGREGMLPDAEVVKAVCDALDLLPEAGPYEVRVGHRLLTEACLQHIGLSKELRPSATSLLAAASSLSPVHGGPERSRRWPSIMAGLQGLGLSANAVARARQMVLHLPGEAGEALVRLRAFFTDLGTPDASPVFASLDCLRWLVAHLETWGLAGGGRLVLDPLLPPHADYYSGTLFQVHALQPAGGATSLLAVGGRWDALLKGAWMSAAAAVASPSSSSSPSSGALPPPPGPPPGAVGATLNVERLVALMTQHQMEGGGGPGGGSGQQQQQQHGGGGLGGSGGGGGGGGGGLGGGGFGLGGAGQRASCADVLVCSKGGGGLLEERMRLLADLWAHGIRAETVPEACPSLTEQYAYANQRGCSWLLILSNAPQRRSADTVRVRGLRRGIEEEVAAEDVCRHMAAALQYPAPRFLSTRGPPRPDPRPDDSYDAADEQQEGGKQQDSGRGGAGRRRRGRN